MNISMRRVNAIFQKDFKDFSRNLAVSIVIFLPLFMAAIYSRMGVDTLQAHYMIFNMTFAIIATYVQCCLIAEEKEKNTLRGLMLSPASTAEILGGKSLLSFVLTMVILLGSALLAEYQPANIGVIALALVLSSFFYIALGTLLGLWAKSVMESSVIVLPVLGIFSFGSFAVPFAEQYPILKVLAYFPNEQLIQIAAKVEEGIGFGSLLSHFSIILIWTVAAAALTVVVYRKRMVD
ncbi:ABC transporter permease [Planococcus sp. YIM B11945]|uniref:ABC transporter permease n=1 Tax=Planococcus sp. YIM B11945 TaxID=3435410 RepID=UPI003D7E5008